MNKKLTTVAFAILTASLMSGCDHKSNVNSIQDTNRSNNVHDMVSVDVEQKPTSGVIVNPDRGFQEFEWIHLNDKKKNPENYIAASTLYKRFNWAQIEPQKGVYDFKLIDDAISDAKSNGMKLSFRIMAMEYHNDWGSHSKLPQYVIDDSNAVKRDGFAFPVPDYSQQAFLDDLDNLVSRLAARYDNPNEISYVDVGIVGSWGEWNLSDVKAKPVELVNNRDLFEDYGDLLEIPKIYKKYFKKVPVVMMIGNNGDPFLAGSTEMGTGWRADCLGDYGSPSLKWGNMGAYPTILESAENINPDFNDSWKKSPVAFELCYNFDKWKKFGYTKEQVAATFKWALSEHVSTIDVVDGGIPEEYRGLVNDVMSKMGYRLILKSGHYNYIVGEGESLSIKTVWENIGSANTYYNYLLEYRLVDQSGKIISTFVTKHGTNQISAANNYGDRPDPIEFSDDIALPSAGGVLTLQMAYVNNMGIPSINIPTTLDSKGKWYDLGSIKVNK